MDNNDKQHFVSRPGTNSHNGSHAGDFSREYRQNQHHPPQPYESNGDRNANNPPPAPAGMRRFSNALEPLPPQADFPPVNQQGFVSNTVQMVRRFTDKVAAINRTAYEPPPPELALYHPQQDVVDVARKPARWRRSRAIRTSMRMRQRRARQQQSMVSPQKVALSLFLALLLILVIMGSSGSAYAYSYYQSQLPQVENISHKQINQVSRIYDRNGVLLGDVYDRNGEGRRTYVDINYIPKVMLDTMVMAENRTFWEDPGIDPGGILRATLDYISHGFKAQQGASTLTQQLVKNLTGNAQPTLDRKVAEGAIAIGLTSQFPKDKILEMYLNVAPFGNLRLGVESAAQEYFGLTRTCKEDYAKGTFNCIPAISQLDYDPVKKTHDPMLALARASFLASLPQDPSNYDPNVWSFHPENKQLVLDRQQSVLNAMMETKTPVKGLGPKGQDGLVTPEIARQVSVITSKMTFKEYKLNWKAPHFMYWVISQIETALGNGDSAKGAVILQNGGYNIRTTIDINLENYVERVIKHQLDEPTYQKFIYPSYTILSRDYNVGDAASVVMNAKTGEILAMAGSKDYDNKAKDPRVAGNYNVATGNDGKDIGRQPGSSFKPIVYATAFEMGLYPGIVLPDYRTYFPNGLPQGTNINADGMWKPDDYGGKPANQLLPLRFELANSFNIPAGKMMAFAGAENVYNTAVRMGITGIEKKAAACIQKKQDLRGCGLGNAMALGTIEVPLTEMAGAYQVFANQGARVQQQGVLDIWDNYGNHLYHFDPARIQKAQVLSPQVAYMVTSMMADEDARRLEFAGDHDLSFWDWEASCSAKTYRPYPDCQEQQVAAKTGTTENFSDNLAMGYTPDVVVGVWVGNANNKPLGENVVGITGAGPIWQAIISRLSGKTCNNVDGVVCGPLDLKKLGLSGQGVFTNPGGLSVKCVSATDGLMGYSGNNCDLIIPGQEPLQAGVTSTTKKDGKGGKGKNN